MTPGHGSRSLRYEPKSLDDIADLVEVLRWLPTHYVVRGRLNLVGTGLVSAGNSIRRCHTTDTIPDPPLEDCPQWWAMVDVDNYAIPAGLVLGTEALIRHVVHDLLPAEFHDVACVWSLSSSCGLTTDLLKCHLWFWLAEPVTLVVMKATLRQRARVDTRVCTPSQPHYTADPILEGGADPFAHCRAGVLAGRPQVEQLHVCQAAIERCDVNSSDVALATAPDLVTDIITEAMIAKASCRPEGGRLYGLMVGAAVRFRREGWTLTAAELANAATQASQRISPGKPRKGLLKEAQHALDHAAVHVQPMTKLERMRDRMAFQLSNFRRRI